MLKDWFEKKQSTFAEYYEQHISVQPMAQSQDDIHSWFASDIGQRFLEKEKACLDRILPEMFGYHLMQLSVLADNDLADSSSTSHQFSVNPVTNKQVATEDNNESIVVAEFEELPIESNSIDVALIHHALDFSLNPHLLLREAARTVIPNGYMVIVGFNPFSMMGIVNPFSRLFSQSCFYRHHHLRVARLKDWCKVLELELLYSHRADFGLPFNQRPFPACERIGQHLLPLCGNFYMLVVRKNITPMTRIDTQWKNKKRLPKWGKGIVSSSRSQSSVITKK